MAEAGNEDDTDPEMPSLVPSESETEDENTGVTGAGSGSDSDSDAEQFMNIFAIAVAMRRTHDHPLSRAFFGWRMYVDACKLSKSGPE